MSATNDSEATTVFVFGILGIMFCPILSPIAWSKGNTYVQSCAVVGVQPNGLGVAGRVLGIIGSLFLGLWVVAFMGGLFLGVLS